MPNVMILSRKVFRHDFTAEQKSGMTKVKRKFDLILMENDVEGDPDPTGTFTVVVDTKEIYGEGKVISRRQASDLLAQHMMDSVT